MNKNVFIALALIVAALIWFVACNPLPQEQTNQLTAPIAVKAVSLETPTEKADLSAPLLLASADTTPVQLNVQVSSPVEGQSVGSWLLKNVAAFVGIFLFIGEVLVRWFPTASNIANFAWISNLLTLIFGNRKIGGGSFGA